MKQPEQPASHGVGPWLERRYYLDVARPRKSPADLMQEVQGDVPRFSPALLADFAKQRGAEGRLQVGDEFHIKILGPWNGCVRVTEVGATFFEFITLEGHPEAGRIRFQAHYLDGRPDVLRIEIHSWARSRDGLVAFAYDTLGVGKQVQAQTWIAFCEAVAAASGGQALGPVITETVTNPAGSPARLEQHG